MFCGWITKGSQTVSLRRNPLWIFSSISSLCKRMVYIFKHMHVQRASCLVHRTIFSMIFHIKCWVKPLQSRNQRMLFCPFVCLEWIESYYLSTLTACNCNYLNIWLHALKDRIFHCPCLLKLEPSKRFLCTMYMGQLLYIVKSTSLFPLKVYRLADITRVVQYHSSLPQHLPI